MSACHARTSPQKKRSTRTASNAAKRACGHDTNAPDTKNRFKSVPLFPYAVIVEHNHCDVKENYLYAKQMVIEKQSKRSDGSLVRDGYTPHLFDKNVNPDSIRRMAGHENIEMTIKYCRGRKSQEELEKKLEQIFSA